jgi:hypothetical protein
MTKTLILFFLIFFLLSCKPTSESTHYPCTIKSAESIADGYLKKRDKLFYNYEKEITEKDKFFIIEYSLKDSFNNGGGATITISKDSCKIVSKQRYQ